LDYNADGLTSNIKIEAGNLMRWAISNPNETLVSISAHRKAHGLDGFAKGVHLSSRMVEETIKPGSGRIDRGP
tara:strand:- start:674 stop:892 length:219 start_codon:yes stop_codon:yes gene_type:complete